ncbi:MAG: adenosylcobinamide-phosphate synthase CbiB, partial [Prevotellaceae bacterium]|nr:adenosylcobinamide-phosphate synthase CbiB [Prevotellaceae bacterium]
PVVWFGKLISIGERKLNHGSWRRLKGAVLAVVLILFVYFTAFFILNTLESVCLPLALLLKTLLVFYCLAGTTLVREVRDVFLALDVSLDKGRVQVSRIVGRDTSRLNENEVKKAALETLAENLSDGVVAPLFWYLLLGLPGMLAYKMINTLDSMIGYRTERYKRFGFFAAKIDDISNYLPARITAILMVFVSLRPSLLMFVARNGRLHASPNSGYPESALAGILNCRFGGGHFYFNEYIYKPFIGTNERVLEMTDMQKAITINRRVEYAMLILVILFLLVASAPAI